MPLVCVVNIAVATYHQKLACQIFADDPRMNSNGSLCFMGGRVILLARSHHALTARTASSSAFIAMR